MKITELRELTCNRLLLVIEEPTPIPSLDDLTKADLEKIAKWAITCHYEASDNPCRARAAPKALRRLLPANHYLQRWRMPKRKARNPCQQK